MPEFAKPSRRISSLLMVFLLIVSFLPLIAIVSQPIVSATPGEGWELVERGTTFNRYYNSATGTYAIEISGLINYEDNEGIWHPIDVNFIASDYGYEITKAPYQAYLENDIQGGKGVKFCAENHWFTYKLSGGKMQWNDGTGKTKSIGAIKSSIAEVENNRIRYENAFSGTTVIYQAMNYGLKELFILDALPTFDNKFGDAYLEYTGELAWDGGLSVWVDGIEYPNKTFTTSSRIEFRDSENNLVFFLMAPYAVDDNGSRCDAIYDVKVSGTKIQYGLRVPYDWLKNENRIYPVVIDPSVSLSNPTQDGFIIYNGLGYTRYSTYDRLVMGCSGPYDYIVNRSYVEWNISSIPDSATITDVDFKYHGDFNAIDCHIHEMLGVKPSTSSDYTVYVEIGGGTVYAAPAGFPVVGTYKQVDLGSTADSHLQLQLDDDYFAIGIQADSISAYHYSNIFAEEYASSPDPTLYVLYSTVSAPTVSTVSATNIGQTTANPRGNVTNTGGENPTRYIQYGTSPGSYPSSKNCGTGGTGTYNSYLTGLNPGTKYYYRAKATNSGGTGYGSEMTFTTKPAAPTAPTGVSATDGTYTDRVRITWTKSTGATGYQVYRDGVALGWLGDVASYDDFGAGAPSITKGTVTATDGTYTDKVRLDASGYSTNNGTTHTYKVRARNAGGESGDSGTNTGYRKPGTLYRQWQKSAADSAASYSDISGATSDPYDYTGAPAPTITHGSVTASDGDYTDKIALSNTGASANIVGRYYRAKYTASGCTTQYTSGNRGYRRVGTLTYQWYKSAGDSDASYSLISGATSSTYNDTAAPAPTITPGSASASDGAYATHVALSLSGQSANIGAGRYYKCYHTATGATSGYTGVNRGYIGVGTLTYQWQRSAADSDADYSDIDGATTASYDDTGAPEDGSGRYYRCVLNATGASQQFSTSNRGYRGEVPNTAPNAPTNLQPSVRQITTPVTISADVTDPDGDTMDVYFYNNDGGAQIGVDTNVASGGTGSVSWSGLTRGNTYTFFARAKDNNDAWGENSDLQSFTVNSLPNKPTNLQPTGEQTTASVTISCVATDNDGDNLNVHFYDNSDNSLIDNIWIEDGQTAQVVWSGLTDGTYVFFAGAQDMYGEWGENSDTQSFWTILGIQISLTCYPEVQGGENQDFKVHVRDLEGNLIDADSAQLSLYDPNSNLILDNVSMEREGEGVYGWVFSTGGYPTGQWLAVAWVQKEPFSAEDREYWKLVQAGPFGIRIVGYPDLTAPTITFELEIHNEGDIKVDATVEWRIDDAGSNRVDEGMLTKAVDPGGRWYPKIDADVGSEGEYTLYSRVWWEETEYADAEGLFTAVAEAAPSIPGGRPKPKKYDVTIQVSTVENLPLENSTVYVDDIVATTGVWGITKLELEGGTYTIRVVKIGYETKSMTVVVDEDMWLQFFLEELAKPWGDREFLEKNWMWVALAVGVSTLIILDEYSARRKGKR